MYSYRNQYLRIALGCQYLHLYDAKLLIPFDIPTNNDPNLHNLYSFEISSMT